MAAKNNLWEFPVNITLEDVNRYLKRFEEMPEQIKYTFNLSNTKHMHSSFIGFLIYVKKELEY